MATIAAEVERENTDLRNKSENLGFKYRLLN